MSDLTLTFTPSSSLSDYPQTICGLPADQAIEEKRFFVFGVLRGPGGGPSALAGLDSLQGGEDTQGGRERQFSGENINLARRASPWTEGGEGRPKYCSLGPHTTGLTALSPRLFLLLIIFSTFDD